MTLRLKTLLTGLLALLMALTLSLGALQAKPAVGLDQSIQKSALGGYQLFEQAQSGPQAPIQLASLGNLSSSAKTASEYANATNNVRSVDPGSPYQVRFNPAHPGRPDPAYSVDTSTFTSGATTANGGIRNNRQFWTAWSGKADSGLSSDNLARVQSGRSPVVDDDWLRVFPEHHDFRGQTIVHHHMDYGQYAIPVPRGAHNNSPGFSIWHPPRGAE